MAIKHRSIQRVAQGALTRDNKLRAQAAKRAGVTTQDKMTADSFVNFAQNMGIGAANPLSSASYGFNPITRVRTILEWIYRGSWLGAVAIDLKADDMTRAGVEIEGSMEPSDMAEVEKEAQRLGVWGALNQTEKWAKLYGGAVAYMMIDGQDPKTPLRVEALAKGQFKGLLPMDRWMIEPSLQDLVTENGPHIGKPKFYTVNPSAPALPRITFHHTRCIRLVGIELPYWQAMMENLWGISVIERVYDRMVAFDSATTGVAQLMYKTHLRTMKVKNFREVVAAGGRAYQGLVAQVNMMRQFQNQEGIALIDSEDELETQNTNAVSGMAEALTQFGQQFSGAVQVPLMRLFGQSPTGFNSGDNDLRMYYDSILQEQKRDLWEGAITVYRATALSLGKTVPPDFGVAFRPLWQMTEKEKVEVAEIAERTVADANERGLISPQTAAKELKQSSKETGVFTNITDADIAKLDEEVAPPAEAAMLGPDGQPLAPEEPSETSAHKGKATEDSLTAVLNMKRIHDLDIVIENPKGSIRAGVGDDGQAFESVMPEDYGYLRRTTGDDGEQVDCFVGPAHDSALVWVINTLNPLTKKPDEQKAMLGFPDAQCALKAFLNAYSGNGGWARFGGLVPYTMEAFKQWLGGKT